MKDVLLVDDDVSNILRAKILKWDVITTKPASNGFHFVLFEIFQFSELNMKKAGPLRSASAVVFSDAEKAH